jgi:EAL domain-containing protein (putative c-di-GMP-specific phosphodiesterase class I)
MYQAKAAGGGRLSFHRASGAVASRRVSMASQLRRAMSRSELELHYEPIWRLDGKHGISGVEALIRWRHPERGLLAPEAFIGVAEQSTACDEVMAWALREACGQAREWRDQGLCPQLSLDVSSRQLRVDRFAARMLEQIRHHGLQASRFTVELTESAWTLDAPEALAVTADLRVGGVNLAIDDFGAGYSSLSRLRDLDFDVIKLDRRLLADVPSDTTAAAVLRAIVDLADGCGASIIAQGIETEEQLKYLRANQIFQAQGSLLGAARPARELTPVLSKHLVQGPVAA